MLDSLKIKLYFSLMYFHFLRVIILFLLITIHLKLSSQNIALPYEQVSLDDLNDFQPVKGNWKIVGEIHFDLYKERNGKTKPGTGILVNDIKGNGKEDILTNLEHGDIDLELEFMMDKNSNAGVYLQGRYEIQMFDSWGVKNPKYSDAGGIYERWDDSRPEGEKGYEGHPPSQNVSKAPGLWQNYKIIFRAPRFNDQGIKTENARFVKVIHNGITIHENVEVSGPTRAAAFMDEKPLGPLMIQGDHGPVAIRNIKYKAYGNEPVVLSDLSLGSFEGVFENLSALKSQNPDLEMKIDVLEHQAPGDRNNFAGKITGNIIFPRTGNYFLNLELSWIPLDIKPGNINGGGELSIGENIILNIDGTKGGSATTNMEFKEGTYPFELYYLKKFGLWYARSNNITFSVEGPGIPLTALNVPFRAETPVGAITVQANNEPVILRSFLNHQGKKKTHVLSVGDPHQLGYSIDLNTGTLLQIWRGDYLETTPMWYGRGESQLAVPLGSKIEFPEKPTLAFLSNNNTVWPDSNAQMIYHGYEIQPDGKPIFKFGLGDLVVNQSFEIEEDGKKISPSFSIERGQGTDNLWCKIAEGTDIEKIENGLYAINNREYYVELPKNSKPAIRTNADQKKEMLLPVNTRSNSSRLKYSIIW